MRVGFVHTIAGLIERFRTSMSARIPQAESFHVLNEALIQGLRRGEPRTEVYRRTVQQLLLAADDGADLVVLTSSSVSPAGEIARSMCTTPILNVADPVSAEAVRIGHRIALLCSHTTASAPGAAMLRQHAAAQGREVLIETVVRPEAYTALFAGDRDRHDAILTEATKDVLPRVDVVVLGQATLGPLEASLSRLGKPVLASMPLLMAELERRLAPAQPTI